jgi:hypothetical protein
MLSLDLLDVQPERFLISVSGWLLYTLAGEDTWSEAARFSEDGLWRPMAGEPPCSPPVIRCDEPLLALFGDQEIDRSEQGYEVFSLREEKQLYLHRPRGRCNVAYSDGISWRTLLATGPGQQHAVGLPLLLYPLSYVETARELDFGLDLKIGPRGRLSELAL